MGGHRQVPPTRTAGEPGKLANLDAPAIEIRNANAMSRDVVVSSVMDVSVVTPGGVRVGSACPSGIWIYISTRSMSTSSRMMESMSAATRERKEKSERIAVLCHPHQPLFFAGAEGRPRGRARRRTSSSSRGSMRSRTVAPSRFANSTIVSMVTFSPPPSIRLTHWMLVSSFSATAS